MGNRTRERLTQQGSGELGSGDPRREGGPEGRWSRETARWTGADAFRSRGGALEMASVLSVKKEVEAGQEIEDGGEGSVGTAAAGNRKEGRAGKRKREGPRH